MMPHRVLLTATSLAPAYGGPATSITRLASALAALGVEAGVWAADGSAPVTPMLPPQSPVRRLAGAPADAFAAFAPDVLHDNGLWRRHHHVLARLAARHGIPRLVSVRGMLVPRAMRQKAWRKKLGWALYQKRDLAMASGLHVTSAAEIDNIEALGLTPPLHVIANGVDMPARPASPGVERQMRTALYLGRLHRQKGLPMLIEAWARIRPRGWRLIVAGPDEGGHLAELRRAVTAAGLDDVVSFPGPLAGDAKAQALLDADLLVLPSYAESFGMAVAEALAYGVPVLTTRGAPWPQLEQEACGWWVPVSTDGLAAGLAAATARDSASLQAMGARGRALMQRDYGWERMAARFLALYRELAAAAGRPFSGRATL
jgi:glycosyltransferase involved in cell wall biosynthesis